MFTGTVKSAIEISFTDKRLQIVPDELFLGDVAGEVTATVNQACLPENLPEIKAGDQWLFFLRTKKYFHPEGPYITTDGLMVDFESPAKPVSLAEYDVCLLRLHSDIDESCIRIMPSRPRADDPFCESIMPPPFPLTNPFVRPGPFQEGIKLTRICAPPEFSTPDANALSATGPILPARRRLLSCSPPDD